MTWAKTVMPQSWPTSQTTRSARRSGGRRRVAGRTVMGEEDRAGGIENIVFEDLEGVHFDTGEVAKTTRRAMNAVSDIEAEVTKCSRSALRPLTNWP